MCFQDVSTEDYVDVMNTWGTCCSWWLDVACSLRAMNNFNGIQGRRTLTDSIALRWIETFQWKTHGIPDSWNGDLQLRVNIGLQNIVGYYIRSCYKEG